MQNILRYLRNVPPDIQGRENLVLLDYDGTLTPIVGRPGHARLPVEHRRKLKDILRRRRLKIGIVTGRALKDIRALLDIEGVLISANHGFEVYNEGRVFYPCGRGFKGPMDELGKALAGHLDHIPGLLLESKGFSVAVHYRLVPRRYWDDIEYVMRRVSAPWRKRYDWELTRGKRLWEVRPSLHWNKGDVSLWIWKKFAPEALPWYFGDDLTDEDAFRAFKRCGVTVTVGRRMNSHAKYFAKNVAEVWQTLQFLSVFI